MATQFKSNLQKAALFIMENGIHKQQNCQIIDLIKLKQPESKSSASESVILSGDYHDIEVIVKLWKQRAPCLQAEYFIYRYVTPFLAFNYITPHVLTPLLTGRCSEAELGSLKMYSPQKDAFEYINSFSPKVEFIVTPLIKETFNSFMKNPEHLKLYFDRIIFQMVFTTFAYSRLGLRQNDTHLDNVRIAETVPTMLNYKVGNKYISITSDVFPVIFDFDRAGISYPINEFLENNDINVKTCTNKGDYLCDEFGQCMYQSNGKRDLWHFLFQFERFMNDNDIQYVNWWNYIDILLTPEGIERMNEFFNADTSDRNAYYQLIWGVGGESEGNVHGYVNDLEWILKNDRFQYLIQQQGGVSISDTKPSEYYSYGNDRMTQDQFNNFVNKYYK